MLIGLEREFHQQKEGSPDFAGIRTFSLISLLILVAAFLVTDCRVVLSIEAIFFLVVALPLFTESLHELFQADI